MKPHYSEIVLSRVVPLLKVGAETGLVELEGDDCKALLFLLQTCVPLEPFLEIFAELTHRTVIDYNKAPAPAPSSNQRKLGDK